MIRQSVLLFIAATLVLAGCSTTGGTIGGLFPAPKFLKGEIGNNIYTAMDKSFSVAVPHKSGSYEYKYMQVKEQYAEDGAYVSFGPAAFNQSIFRIHTAKRPKPGVETRKFDDIAPLVLEAYNEQLQTGYSSAPQVSVTNKEDIKGRKAYYWKMTQVVPAGKYYNNRDTVLTHEVYVIDFENGVVFVGVQIPEDTREPALEPRAFAESVLMY